MLAILHKHNLAASPGRLTPWLQPDMQCAGQSCALLQGLSTTVSVCLTSMPIRSACGTLVRRAREDSAAPRGRLAQRALVQGTLALPYPCKASLSSARV